MGALDGLLDQVKNAISQHATKNNHDASDLLSHVTNLFGKHPSNGAQDPPRNVKPASQDPYGDPASQAPGGRDVKPASEDPYGDPADQKR